MTPSRGPIPNLGLSSPMRDLLHTPSVPGDHPFHDSGDCPHGAGITRYDDLPGAAYPRRCNWCTEHDRPTSS
jgi:hypothetical protein